jgi:Uma2 family endonuclease
MTVTTLHTAEELLRMPDDGNRYELVEGELKRMSPAGSDHSTIALLIGSSLLVHVKKHRLGVAFGADGGFMLGRDPDTVRAPDAAFVSAERVVKTSKYFPGAPDLAIEVVSPNDRWSDVDAKTTEYLRAGTRAVVVVDPEKQIVRVYRMSGDDIVARTAETFLEVEDVVPGWKMPLSEIFDA